MIYEIVDFKLKEHQKLIDKVISGLRSLKSANTVNRKRRLETLFERSNKFLESSEALDNNIRSLIKVLIKEIPVSEVLRAPDGTLYSMPIKDLGLSNRAINILEKEGIFTLGDLAGMEDITSLYEIKGLGLLTKNDIENLLIRTGIKYLNTVTAEDCQEGYWY